MQNLCAELYIISWMQAFLDGVGNALAAQSTAAQKCEAMAQLSTSGIPEKVSKAADEMLQREAAARVGLRPSPGST